MAGAMEEGQAPAPHALPQIQLEDAIYTAIQKQSTAELKKKPPFDVAAFKILKEQYLQQLALTEAKKKKKREKKRTTKKNVIAQEPPVEPKDLSGRCRKPKDHAEQLRFLKSIKKYEVICMALARHALFFTTAHHHYPELITTWNCSIENFKADLQIAEDTKPNDALKKCLNDLDGCLSEEYKVIGKKMSDLGMRSTESNQSYEWIDFVISLTGLVTSYKKIVAPKECLWSAFLDTEIQMSWRSLLRHASVIFDKNVTIDLMTADQDANHSWVYKICDRYVDSDYVKLQDFEDNDSDLDK